MMNMKANATKLYFGQAAYEAVARAIGHSIGLRITKIADGSPAIDASGTIFLPSMHAVQTHAEFEETCASLVHELAHLYFSTHNEIPAMQHDQMLLAAMNGVVDVADEIGIAVTCADMGNARPGELLDKSNANAIRANWNKYTDWNDAASHAWKVICACIFYGRKVSGSHRLKKYTIQAAAACGVDVAQCFSLIAKARNRKYAAGARRYRHRRFRLYRQLARQVADILAPFTPPQTNGIGNGLAAKAAVGIALPAGAMLADGIETEVESLTESAVGAHNAYTAKPRRSKSAGGNAPTNTYGVAACAQSFSMLRPAVDAVAMRIALDGDAIDRESGLTAGGILGQVHRLNTDGNCLARFDTKDNADGVACAVVLDCSDSMTSILRECAGIARAFAVSMKDAGPVHCFTFGCNVMPANNDFANVQALGSTNTAQAITSAAASLRKDRGARWIVLISDGSPNDINAASAAARAAQHDGIKVMLVGLNAQLTMPADFTANAANPTALAIELQAAAQRIGCN